MAMFKRWKIRTLTVLFCILTFTTFLCSYTLRDPSFYFFKYAFRLSDNFFSKGACACRHCMTEADDDPWFTERFNQSFHPLLSKRNSLLTEDTYRWWQWLQAERHPANFSDVVDRLFQLIPGEDRYVDAGPERCRTCAVVGNSGNLKDSRYGSLIDSSDFIIRMNQAPTQGFEVDVGSRTTHHVMYPESAVDLDNTTSLVLIPFKTLDLEWIISALTTGYITHTYLPVMSRIQANKDRVLIYSPSFFKYVHEAWLDSHGRYPSTGFLTLIFAMHICDQSVFCSAMDWRPVQGVSPTFAKLMLGQAPPTLIRINGLDNERVSVYGFGADQYGNWHHYWEENHLAGAFRHTGVHDGDYEYNVTLLLADKHKIKLFKGG